MIARARFSRVSLAGVAASLLAAGAALPPARAEEGLFVARLSGGATAMAPAGGEAIRAGGTLSGAVELGLAARAGIAVEVSAVFHPAWTTVALAPGFLLLPASGDWARVFVFAGPAALLLAPRDGPSGAGPRVDLGVRAALGVQWLWLWGFGGVLQLGAILPFGLGAAAFGAGASADVTAGLFMEF